MYLPPNKPLNEYTDKELELALTHNKHTAEVLKKHVADLKNYISTKQ